MADDWEKQGFSPTLVLIAVALAVTLFINVAERKAVAANKWQGPPPGTAQTRTAEPASNRCVAVDPMGVAGFACRGWPRRAEAKPGQG